MKNSFTKNIILALCILLFIITSVIKVNGQPQPVGQWKFEQNLFDNSSNQNEAISSGQISYVTSGIPLCGYSVTFNGTDQYLTIPDITPYHFGTGAFSVFMKINTTTTTPMTLFEKISSTGGCSGIRMVLNAGQLTAGTSSSNTLTYTTNLSDGQWHCISFERIPDGYGACTLKLIVGNVVVVSVPYANLDDVSNTSPIHVGVNSCSTLQDYYDGYLDELSIFNAELPLINLFQLCVCDPIVNYPLCMPTISTDCSDGHYTLCAHNLYSTGTDTYLWSNGYTTQCIDATTMGTYSVTISGCPEVSSEVNPERDGWAVVTYASTAGGEQWNPTHLVMGLMDIKSFQTVTPNTNWGWPAVNAYNGGGSWNVDNLGEIFGVAHDNVGNIFVTATTAYGPSNFTSTHPAGGVYRIDAVTGNINLLCTLPNYTGTCLTNTYSYCTDNTNINHEPGLGNICYDKLHGQLFVTNFEDGKIYRINARTGTVISTFDPVNPGTNPPMVLDDGYPGFAPLGERLWGIGIYGSTVYYSVWSNDRGRNNGNYNSIHSVILDPITGGFNGSDQFLFDLPFYTLNNSTLSYSNPVSDIEFSEDGRSMLLAERTMNGDMKIMPSGEACWAHQSRVLEYFRNSTSQYAVWQARPTTRYEIGPNNCNIFNGANASGGVDFGYNGVIANNNDSIPINCDGAIWAMGDALHLDYGLQLPRKDIWVAGITGNRW